MDLQVGVADALGTDYFFLKERLTDAPYEVLLRTREFSATEVQPVINDYWQRAEFPWPLVEKLGALGVIGDGIAGYECPDLDPISVGLETRARRDGDSYVLDGEKKWIGNGSIADVIVVWARDTGDHQVKGFLVEKGTPGYSATVIEGKGALRAVWQAHISLEGVRVPAEAKLPGANPFNRLPGHAAHGRRRSGAHVRGHRNDADPDRRARHHRHQRLRREAKAADDA